MLNEVLPFMGLDKDMLERIMCFLCSYKEFVERTNYYNENKKELDRLIQICDEVGNRKEIPQSLTENDIHSLLELYKEVVKDVSFIFLRKNTVSLEDLACYIHSYDPDKNILRIRFPLRIHNEKFGISTEYIDIDLNKPVEEINEVFRSHGIYTNLTKRDKVRLAIILQMMMPLASEKFFVEI